MHNARQIPAVQGMERQDQGESSSAETQISSLFRQGKQCPLLKQMGNATWSVAMVDK